jgi:hypothetical protein
LQRKLVDHAPRFASIAMFVRRDRRAANNAFVLRRSG